MSRSVLILRPEPGASATAERARALGLEPIVVPLFRIAARPWALPDRRFDAVLMTSANAARFGGEAMRPLHTLPLYAVGEATAEAARAAGFAGARVAGPDVMASFERLRADGRRDVLHLAAEHRTGAEAGDLRLASVAVYASEAIDPAPLLAQTLARLPVVLVHSARAARCLAACVEAERWARDRVDVAALSPAVAAVLGEGWRSRAVAAAPTDDALLEVASSMCD